MKKQIERLCGLTGWSVDRRAAAKPDSALSTTRRSWGLSPPGRTSTSTSPAYLLLAQGDVQSHGQKLHRCRERGPFCRGLASAPTLCDRPSAIVRHRGSFGTANCGLMVQRLNWSDL